MVLPVVRDAWARVGARQPYGDDHTVMRRLLDVGDQRLADMDDQGIDVAVLPLACRTFRRPMP